LSGDLIEHKIHDGSLFRMALSGDKIIISNGGVIQVFNVSTCSFLFSLNAFFYFFFMVIQLIGLNNSQSLLTACHSHSKAILCTLGSSRASFNGTWSPIQF
jgi:hypothetical protein